MATRMATVVRPTGARNLDTAAKMPAKEDIHPNYFKLKDKQAKMKENMHLPVHRKGGQMDDICRWLTYALAAYVMVESVKVIYILAYPQKK